MARTLCLAKLHYGLTFMLFVCQMSSDQLTVIFVSVNYIVTDSPARPFMQDIFGPGRLYMLPDQIFHYRLPPHNLRLFPFHLILTILDLYSLQKTTIKVDSKVFFWCVFYCDFYNENMGDPSYEPTMNCTFTSRRKN